MPDLTCFDNEGQGFEVRGISNGGRKWYASDLMEMLGYSAMASLQGAINRAIGTCSTLNIPVMENFQQCHREIEGEQVSDYKLSRFACYLVAMNGDVRKPEVATAQAYFAGLAEAARNYINSVEDVERVQIRDDISDREKSLAGTAGRAGVDQYALFHNEGYRGMYNLDYRRLCVMKGLPEKRTLLDFMDKRELAGNLFRVTETEAKIKSERVYGQGPAERVAFGVGRQVRNMMIENTGTLPELIPLADDIKDVRKGLKATAREYKKLDKPK